MALTYEIDPGRRLVTITGEYADEAGWKALLLALIDDPAYERGFAFLRDLRSARHPVDASTVVRIFEVVRPFWDLLGARRGAIVTPRNMDAAAVVPHALANAEDLPLRAFTSYDAAMEWLQD
jgi:hypothetical protein